MRRGAIRQDWTRTAGGSTAPTVRHAARWTALGSNETSRHPFHLPTFPGLACAPAPAGEGGRGYSSLRVPPVHSAIGGLWVLLGLSTLLTTLSHGASKAALALGEWARAKRAEIRGAM